MSLSLNRLLNSHYGFPSKGLFGHFFSSTVAHTRSFSLYRRISPLYRRISPLGDSKISMVPVLDEWVQKGRTVNEEELRDIIQKLNHYRRFKHALEISQWMSDKRYIPLMPRDIALRMNLILKVHGLEQVENYFNNIHKNLKTYQVYIALLNCYALEKSVDKAEAIMQRLRDLGLVRTAPRLQYFDECLLSHGKLGETRHPDA
ncbi:hypothetical protein PVL29_012876 [Vitis rotundifolia]|uniref:Pentatricopeptide repeat-containing protein n=1 Tax=Vitis rotundifolia TaxID=103349 RepID=A0AA38ZLB9_VITRO|nr:hypothetical protein PVL29_012876 [Vitis rotundifolia]